MKPFQLLFTLIIFSFSAQAFGQIRLRGNIKSEAGEPVPFVNVRLLTAEDSALIAGAVTDSSGMYAFNGIEAGEYKIAASAIGFKSIQSDLIRLTGTETERRIPVLNIPEDVTLLDDVAIEGEKPLYESRIDRLVINVQNAVSSAGGSGLEVLERAPGVLVDRMNNSLSMNGKQGVIILINGKQNHMPVAAALEMLEGTPSDNIEKIEIISNPPAKYDAEGDAGIINIVLRQGKDEGLNGSATLSAGYGYAEKLNGSGLFNYRTENINLYADYSYLRNNNREIYDLTRKVDRHAGAVTTTMRSVRKPLLTVHNARLGIDVNLSASTQIGFLAAGYNRLWKMNALNEAHMTSADGQSAAVFTHNDEINDWKHAMGNINLQHKFSEKSALNVDFDYLYYHDDNPADYINAFTGEDDDTTNYQQVRSGKKTPIHISLGKIDYSSRISDRILWEAGVKSVFSRFSNDIQVERLEDSGWIPDPAFTNKYDLREDIHALYASFDLKLSDRTEAAAGIRYEHTRTDVHSLNDNEESIKRRYNSFFPSVFLSHKLSPDHTLRLSYSRRISRPTYNDLAPFVIFWDPNTFYTGNPYLEPAITNAARLEFQLFNSYLLSAQYSLDKNAIVNHQPRIDAEENRQLVGAINVNRQKTLSFSTMIPVFLTNWWETANHISGFFQHINDDYSDQSVEIKNFSWNFNMTHTFKPLPGITAEATIAYQSPVVFGVYKTKDRVVLNLGLQKEFRHGKLRLSVDDLLYTGSYRYGAYLPELNLDIQNEWQEPPRIVRLSYSFTFGQGKVNANRRETGSEEERRRVN